MATRLKMSRGPRSLLLFAGLVLLAACIFLSCKDEGKPPPDHEPAAVDLTELQAVSLLEMAEEGEFSFDEVLLYHLSQRIDAVGYRANLALARRALHKEGSGDPTPFYRQALHLHVTVPVSSEFAAFLERQGLYAEALEQYRLFLPDQIALDGLLRLEEDHLDVAEILLDERHWETAIKLLEHLLTAGDWDEGAADGESKLKYLYLRALAGAGHWVKALPLLQEYRSAYPVSEQVEWWYARSLEAAGRREEALAAYEKLGERGAYRRAMILEQQGRLEKAADSFLAAPEAESRWRGARLWENLGHSEKALPAYMDLAAEGAPPSDDAAYRAYILLLRDGDPQAVDYLVYLAAQPAWMERLGKEPQREIHPVEMVEELPFLQKAEIYLESGREELAELELLIGIKFISTPERLTLGEWYLDRGDYLNAVRQGMRVLRERPCPRAYHLSYPLLYEDAVFRAAGEFSLDPYLVLAVMREESHYHARAVSWVGAQGLMQIMPGTGRDIAAQLGMEFELEDLFDPELNIRFGAFYLRAMLNTFNGEIDRALAAYNGGPGNVRRWLETTLGKDPEGFPTAIPFVETREYITKVQNSYLTYLWLYGESAE